MMDSRDHLDNDAPLSITRTFLRQAAALGLPDTCLSHCGPLASVTPPPGAPREHTAEPGHDQPPPACRIERSRIVR